MRACHVFVLLAMVSPVAAPAAAQTRAAPRRQWVTLALQRSHGFKLHVKRFPYEQLAGTDLNASRQTTPDFVSPDGTTTLDVLEFGRRGEGGSITVYPLGAARGATLALRASYETLPVIRLAIHRSGTAERYAFEDGRAVDFGAGVIVADRSAGWGLGAHSFALAGLGRVRSSRGDGDRLFGEMGGGVTVGPFGVELAVKFAYNRMEDPRVHSFLSVPVSLRGTVSF